MKTVTGNPIVISDAKAGAVEDLKVSFEPKQDMNGYSKPWAGGAGENLLPFIACDNATRSGITWTKNADGSIHIKGTATASEVMSRTQNVLATDKSYLTYFDPGKYAITSFGGRLWVQFTDEEQSKQTFSGNTILDGQTAYYTFTERTAVYARISVKSSDGAVDNDVKVSVVKEWTAPTEWTPYENICPITGFDSLSVIRTNKNLYPSLEGHEETRYYGITFTYNDDGSITANGTSTGVAFSWQVMFYLKAGKYTKPVNLMVQDPNNGWANVSGGGYMSTEFTIPEEMQVVVRWRIPSGVTLENEVFYPYVYPNSVTDLTYEEQIKDEYTFNLGRTVYGGKVSAKNGILTVTDALIASYNGESLPSTWLSDRDEYKAGTTPTIRAQVVYKLATPLTYQLTAQQIRLLQGNNIISTDGDTIELTYEEYVEIIEHDSEVLYLLTCLSGDEDFDSDFTPKSRVGDLLYSYLAGTTPMICTDPVESRVEYLLKYWLGFESKSSYISLPPRSRVEAILSSKIEGTSYTGETLSDVEKLLIRITI